MRESCFPKLFVNLFVFNRSLKFHILNKMNSYVFHVLEFLSSLLQLLRKMNGVIKDSRHHISSMAMMCSECLGMRTKIRW